jgi:hypothetical protein
MKNTSKIEQKDWSEFKGRTGKDSVFSNKKEKNILDCIEIICKEQKIEMPEIIFEPVDNGGVKITHILHYVYSVHLDLNKVGDLTTAVLQSLAHVILIRKFKDAGNGARFSKLWNKLSDEYMYSDIDRKLNGYGTK